MRAVLDTNIVIDLLHFADPQTQPLQRGIATGDLRCFTDRDCFAELQRVSAYRQFGLDARAQAALLDRYRHFVIACEREPAEDYLLPRCRDVDDQKFLVLGVRCRAELLITRDRRLLQVARHRLPVPYAIVTLATAAALLLDR
ncbi:MAG: PIN domain-containing protein [Candidatus Accumulibacter sp. UW25]|jgi:predicted nucleic acid-binding protein